MYEPPPGKKGLGALFQGTRDDDAVCSLPESGAAFPAWGLDGGGKTRANPRAAGRRDKIRNLCVKMVRAPGVGDEVRVRERG